MFILFIASDAGDVFASTKHFILHFKRFMFSNNKILLLLIALDAGLFIVTNIETYYVQVDTVIKMY